MVVSIALIVFGYWYKNSVQDKIQRVIKVTDCQISKAPCRIEISKEKFLTLSVLPVGIPQTQPLDIDVMLEGVSTEEVFVNFEGIEINHNLLPYSLTKRTKNHFRGKGFISLCSLRKMSWLANIIINTDGEMLKVSFPFETVYN
ncbi:MAG: hypothetical protein ABGX45_01750 [Candidatus Thioglobus sp.]|jgi:hypothetical protein|nr:hypothetical protein [Candidatus Thioglobus sp.]